jgi:hypothetical protein
MNNSRILRNWPKIGLEEKGGKTLQKLIETAQNKKKSKRIV